MVQPTNDDGEHLALGQAADVAGSDVIEARPGARVPAALHHLMHAAARYAQI